MRTQMRIDRSVLTHISPISSLKIRSPAIIRSLGCIRLLSLYWNLDSVLLNDSRIFCWMSFTVHIPNPSLFKSIQCNLSLISFLGFLLTCFFTFSQDLKMVQALTETRSGIVLFHQLKIAIRPLWLTSSGYLIIWR